MDWVVTTYYKINAKGNAEKNIKNDDEMKLRSYLSKNKGLFAEKC